MDIPFQTPRRLGFHSILAHLIDLATLGGHLVRLVTAPLHLSNCGGSSGPCECTWPEGLSSTYTVSGWSGLITCTQCDASSAAAWSGALNHIGSGCIWWAADESFDPLSINGAMLDIIYTQVLLRTTVTPCRWELYIACGSLTNPTQTMWYGYKISGDTPAGTYSFVGSDCGNTTATMTIS